jgi:hypothetical protein
VNGEQLQDEYDPSKPNDFEEILKQRQKKQREAEEEAERLARMREIQQVWCCGLRCPVVAVVGVRCNLTAEFPQVCSC